MISVNFPGSGAKILRADEAMGIMGKTRAPESFKGRHFDKEICAPINTPLALMGDYASKGDVGNRAAMNFMRSPLEKSGFVCR